MSTAKKVMKGDRIIHIKKLMLLVNKKIKTIVRHGNVNEKETLGQDRVTLQR